MGVAINVGSMGTKTAAHLLKYDTVLGTLKADVSFTDEAITVDGKVFKVVTGPGTKTAINGFGRIGRNVLRCWLGRATKPFDIVAINAGSMSPQTTAHLLKYDTV